jgi:MOSC domain-containing protein YiiM
MQPADAKPTTPAVPDSPRFLAGVRVRHIFVSPGHNFRGHHGGPAGTNPLVEVAEVRCVAGRGIEGDRYFDLKPDYKGQITFFSWEVYQDLCRMLGVADRGPGVFRRNVIVEGVDLNTLIGCTFELQGVRFEGACECTPCDWMDHAFSPGAEVALKGRGGLRARIFSDGVLRADGN